MKTAILNRSQSIGGVPYERDAVITVIRKGKYFCTCKVNDEHHQIYTADLEDFRTCGKPKEVLFRNMDWKLLREQKVHLLNVLSTEVLLPEEYDALEGILHLIDAVQDHAVDILNYDTNKVFNHDNDI